MSTSCEIFPSGLCVLSKRSDGLLYQRLEKLCCVDNQGSGLCLLVGSSMNLYYYIAKLFVGQRSQCKKTTDCTAKLTITSGKCDESIKESCKSKRLTGSRMELEFF